MNTIQEFHNDNCTYETMIKQLETILNKFLEQNKTKVTVINQIKTDIMVIKNELISSFNQIKDIVTN